MPTARLRAARSEARGHPPGAAPTAGLARDAGDPPSIDGIYRKLTWKPVDAVLSLAKPRSARHCPPTCLAVPTRAERFANTATASTSARGRHGRISRLSGPCALPRCSSAQCSCSAFALPVSTGSGSTVTNSQPAWKSNSKSRDLLLAAVMLLIPRGRLGWERGGGRRRRRGKGRGRGGEGDGEDGTERSMGGTR